MTLTLNLRYLDGNFDPLLLPWYYRKTAFGGLAVACFRLEKLSGKKRIVKTRAKN